MKSAVDFHRSVVKEEYIDGILGGNAMRFWGLSAE